METFIPILIAIILFSISLFFFIRSNQNQPNTNKKNDKNFIQTKKLHRWHFINFMPIQFSHYLYCHV